MIKASDILFTSWEDIPIQRVKLILQLLPLIRWNVHDSASNTYLKNFLLKQLFKSKKVYLKTTPEQRVDMFTHELEWIKDFPVTFPIKTYNLAGIHYHAPEDLIANITVERLMEADIALYRFIRSEKQSYLHHFLSQIYVPRSVSPQTEIQNPKSEIFSQIPTHESIAIIRAYMGSFNQLRKSCPNLFPVTSSGSANPKSEIQNPKSKDPANSWQKLLFELANTPGYPGMEAAKSALAWEALPYMDHEQEKIHLQMERLKKSRV